MRTSRFGIVATPILVSIILIGACVNLDDVPTACTSDPRNCDEADATGGDGSVDSAVDTKPETVDGTVLDTDLGDTGDAVTDIGTDAKDGDVLGDSCVPLKACPTGKVCGSYPDGCGGIIDCGTCPTGASCTVASNTCRCGTCGALAKKCGSWSDGCGATLDCGSCKIGCATDGSACLTIDGISLGGNHACVSLTDGSLRCWGNNAYGQLADGTTAPYHPFPVAVPISKIKSASTTGVPTLSAGGAHTCAVGADGLLRCWGWNYYGQLGDGTTTDRSSPTVIAVSSTTPVRSVSAGGTHTCALLEGGTVKCWGKNGGGELGDGTTIDRLTPTSVDITGVIQIVAAGGYFTCALISDLSVKCWGFNGLGELGDGTTFNRSTPTTVPGLTNALQLAAGADHICALTADNVVKCWGYNEYGQVGDGTTINRSTPTLVPGLTLVENFTAGANHSCIGGGAVWCWGENRGGCLGDGTTTDRHSPKSIGYPGSVVAGQGTFTCALTDVDSVSCWGDNNSGQLCDGTVVNRYTPAPIVW